MKQWLAISTFTVCMTGPVWAGGVDAGGVGAAFERLYNFDFEGSRQAAAAYIAAHGADPMGHAVHAAGLLFSELNRLNALSDSFGEEKLRSAPLKTVPLTAQAFWSSVAEARRRALSLLEADPAHHDALHAMVIVTGLERDYTALIDRKLRRSLDHIREAHRWSLRLLEVDPGAHDAYLNTGFSEYLVGSFPAFLRWAVRIDGVRGDKRKGLEQLERAARSGRYMKAFAQLLLANMYRKEGRLRDSERMLRALLADYPENAVVRRELARLNAPPSSLSR